MKWRLVLATVVLAFVATGVAMAIEPGTSGRRAGQAFFIRPTQVAGKTLIGKVLIVHDDARMARGEACTTIYTYHGDRAEEAVTFMCEPQPRTASSKMTVRCAPKYPNLTTDVLTEYQFAGETEAHGVPVR